MMKSFLAHWATRAGGFFLLLAFAALVSHAQPSSGGPQPGLAPTATPIDGGASLLLASGIALGLKKLRRKPR